MITWKQFLTAGVSLITLSSASIPLPTLAVELTFQYSGTVDSVYDFNETGLINVGNPIVGTYTFESDTLGDEIEPGATRYDFTPPLQSTIQMGNYMIEGFTRFIGISNGSSGLDEYYVKIDGKDFGGFVSLFAPYGTAFSSDSLLSSPPDVLAFSDRYFYFSSVDYAVEGTINSIQNITPTTPVPFELSPSIGILALGALYGATQLKSKVKKLNFYKSAVK